MLLLFTDTLVGIGTEHCFSSTLPLRASDKEYRSISVDATYKLAFKVRGPDAHPSDNHTNVVGLRGCPLALEPVRGEGVKAIATAVAAAVLVAYRAQVSMWRSTAARRPCTRRSLRALAGATRTAPTGRAATAASAGL